MPSILATTTPALASDLYKKEIAFIGGVVNVDYSGAAGDGVTVDTDVINQALQEAGDYGVIIFSPNKVYLVDSALQMRIGQRLVGYGATIKRIDQVLTTTDDPVTTTSPKVINVADATGFRVGMGITFFTGVPGSQTYSTRLIEIVSINGNEIGYSLPSTVDLVGTVSVVTSFASVIAQLGSPMIEGLIFDGNSINNRLFNRWETQSEILLSEVPGKSYVKNCLIKDSAVEGITFGGDDILIDNVTILNSFGNNVHLAGATNVRIVNCLMDGANLGGADAGHQDGCISSSNSNGKVIIANNHFKNATFSAVGGLGNVAHDSFFMIVDNEISDCAGGAFDLVGNPLEESENIVMAGNQIHNCGLTIINSGGSSTYNPGFGNNGHVLKDNLWLNSRLSVAGSYNIKIEGNVFDGDVNGNAVLLDLWNMRDSVVLNNTFINGSNHIRFNGPSAAGVLISGNRFYNNSDICVRVDAGKIEAGKYVTLENNMYTAGPASLDWRTFVVGRTGLLIKGNTIVHDGSFGIQVEEPCVVSNNNVILPATTPSIVVEVGGAGSFIKDNNVTTTTNDISGSATIEGEVILP